MMNEISSSKVIFSTQDIQILIMLVESSKNFDRKNTITWHQLIQKINYISENTNTDHLKGKNCIENVIFVICNAIKGYLRKINGQRLDGVEGFLDHIWTKYDTDHSGSIDATET